MGFFLSIDTESINFDHHLRCGGWLNLVWYGSTVGNVKRPIESESDIFGGGGGGGGGESHTQLYQVIQHYSSMGDIVTENPYPI